MKLPIICVPFLALGAFAFSENVLEKRRAASCTSYPAANSKLTVCQTNTAYCTSYLGRGPSTSTVYTTTIRQTRTPPAVTVKSTSTTKTFTSTIYTKTSTVTAPASTTTTTYTATASVTASETATKTGTESRTLTVSTTKTTTQTETITATVPDIPCSSVQQKRAEVTPTPIEINARAAQTKAPASCGMTMFSSSTISGACSCLMDKTTSMATTTTTTLSRSLTTVIVPTSGTVTVSTISYTTTTPTVTVSTTVTPYTTTVATTTVATTTVNAFTTTVATITTTVGTSTEKKTSTTTETSMQPRCTQDDRNSFNDGESTFVSYCDTYWPNFVVQTVDATDMFDCMSQCQTYNDYNQPWSCIGISFNQAQCNQNCELKAGIYTTGATSDPNFQSASLLSPAVGEYGNECFNGAQFGDATASPSGLAVFTYLCGVDFLGYDINCQKDYTTPDQGGEEKCLTNCATNDTCTAAGYNFIGGVYSCCAKYAHPEDAYMVQNVRVDSAIRVDQYVS